MRAAYYEHTGPARDVLHVGCVETPVPTAGEVLVRVYASAVNPSDTKSRSGGSAAATMSYPRVIPHQDGAGVIEAVGEDVRSVRLGDRVWIHEAQWRRPFGSCAEFIALPESRVAGLPGNVTFAHGACLGIPAMTAHRCVFADGPVTGQTILVTGGSGAVGFYAVQFAKRGGAQVIATVNTEQKAERAKQAGADHVINYASEDVPAAVKDITRTGVDRIIEVALGPNLPISVQILRPNGIIAAYASDADPEPKLPFGALRAKNATLRSVLVYGLPQSAKDHAIREITAALESGELQHQIHAEMPLDEVVRAHEIVESGNRNGAVIVLPG
jgi:NADPH:quinone reductase